jgi:hypothetical protein
MRLSLLAIVAALVAACGATAGGTTAGSSGLHGTFRIGPTQPVCQEGTDCNGPARRAQLSFSRAGKTTSTRTDLKGAYRVTLAPGWYAVRTSVGIQRVPTPARVRVVAGRYRTVNFFADTGIR